MKQLQVLLIVFCLGIFLVPKDNFYAQISQENCCKTDSKADNCCDKDHNSHNKNEKSSCNDDCCSSCMTCCTFVENISGEAIFVEISLFQTDKNIQFQYSDPYFSDSLEDIWQPPKLG